MGTSNFYNKNASKYFAVLMDSEQPVLDDEGNETEETEIHTVEDYEVDDFIEYIHEKLTESKFENWIPTKLIWEKDSNRNFEGRILGELSEEKKYGDVWAKVEIEVIMRNGYYEGANLDWNIKFLLDGNEVDEDCIREDFVWNSDLNTGLATMVAQKAEKWMSNKRGELISEIERIFTEISEPLVKVATFSNGETIYSKAN